MKKSHLGLLTTCFATLMLACIVFMTSCSNGGGSSANASFSMKTGVALSKFSASDTIVIDTAKVLITKLKFESFGGDSENIKTGPFVISLDLSGTTHTIVSVNLPHGTYDRIKFELHKPKEGESVPDDEFYVGPESDQRFSVIIIGRYNGVRFVFKSKDVINESISIDPPLIVADSIGIANATLVVDPSLFFKKDGLYLDPTDTTSSNVSAINKSIKDAFLRALKDDNKTGEDE